MPGFMYFQNNGNHACRYGQPVVAAGLGAARNVYYKADGQGGW